VLRNIQADNFLMVRNSKTDSLFDDKECEPNGDTRPREYAHHAEQLNAELCETAAAKQAMGLPCRTEQTLAARLTENQEKLYDRVQQLTQELKAVPTDAREAAQYCRQVILTSMDAIRISADRLEELTAKKYWPFPTYSDLLFY